MNTVNENELFVINLLKSRRYDDKYRNFITSLSDIEAKSIYCQSFPAWLTIDPTNICNLRCPFCPTGFGHIKRRKGKMSLEHFKRILDILGPYLLHIDMQNWGEPLLNEDIYKMIHYAKKFNIHITLSSNFQKFDEAAAEEMVNSGLDRLILSIDGASQESYEKYRRGGSFTKAIDNIKILTKKKKELNSRHPTVIWQFLVFRHNEHEIEQAKKMGREMGVDDVGINSAFIAVDSSEFKDWVPLDSRYNRYNLAEAPKKIEGSESFLKNIKDAACNWLWQGITINWDGSVSPCCGTFMEEEDFGNIFEQSFMQLWNNSHYRLAREYMRKRVKTDINIKNTCVNCPKIGQINLVLDQDFWIRG